MAKTKKQIATAQKTPEQRRLERNARDRERYHTKAGKRKHDARRKRYLKGSTGRNAKRAREERYHVAGTMIDLRDLNLTPDEVKDLRRRFEAKVDRNGKYSRTLDPCFGRCWIWKGALWANNQRPVMRVGQKRIVGAIISWFLSRGSWPTDDVCHACDTKMCTNPDHLFEGTDSDNITDFNIKKSGAILSYVHPNGLRVYTQPPNTDDGTLARSGE